MAWSPFGVVDQDANPPIHFNTGTVFDLYTGTFVQGYDGEWYNNGGISYLMYLIQGPTNSYKSTMADSIMANVLAIYQDMFSLVFDTETHKLSAAIHNKEKSQLSSRYDLMTKLIRPVSDRIIIGKSVNISDILSDLISLRKDRAIHEKDITIETPFLNSKGDRIRSKIIMPVIIDSFSSMESPAEADLIDKHALEESKLNMLFINDGKRKTVFSRALKTIARESGMAFLCTGHTGEKKDLENIMSKPKRHMQYMKPGQVIKGVGSNVTYGAQVVMETNASVCKTSDNKEIMYPVSSEPENNLNDVTMLFQKGKNSVSGTIARFVVTQTHGLNNALSCVDYVRGPNTNGFNFSGAGNAFFSTAFTPDTKSSRKNIRDHLDDSYELRRAYDLIAQTKFISENVDPDLVPLPIKEINLNKACEKILSQKGTLVQDILNSRGYWTYKDDPRPYMSIYRVLDLLSKD